MQNILDGTSKKCPERALLLRAGGQGIGQESSCIIVAALLDAISLTTLTREENGVSHHFSASLPFLRLVRYRIS